MAVSVSSIVADMRTVITQLVDDLNGLHAGVSQSSLTTVMGLSKEGAVPDAGDRTAHFENDTTFAELMEADDETSAADYLARSVALSGGIATAAHGVALRNNLNHKPLQSSHRAPRGDEQS